MRENSLSGRALAVAVILLGLLCVSFIQSRLLDINDKYKLTDTEAVDNAPPMVVFTTVALGCFRGLMADMLWLRSISLQDQGKYFEMVQLADWICKLQPRFAGASAYLAWNMAYNISVTFSSWEDRWRWVRHGIELLRETITYNPGDADLYRELGWIYIHKIGDIFDDANLYYKEQLAMEMNRVYGGSDPNWKALAATPDSTSDFYKGLGDAKALKETLKAKGYSGLSALESVFRDTGELPLDLKGAIKAPGDADKLVLYLRRRWLLEVYKLEPEVVVQINERYGAFDWRLPQAFSVYWATLGKERSRDKENLNVERMINQSIKDSFLEGRLIIAGQDKETAFLCLPNMNLADAAKDTFMNSFEKHDSTSFKSAFENFMIDSILIFYSYGERGKAEAYLGELRKKFPFKLEFKRGLDNFVMGRWKENIIDGSRDKVKALIDGMLFQACVFMSFGDDAAAAGHEKLAQVIYGLYRQSQKDTWERMGLPPFERMKRETVNMCLKNFKPSLAQTLRERLGLDFFDKQESLSSDSGVAESDEKSAEKN